MFSRRSCKPNRHRVQMVRQECEQCLQRQCGEHYTIPEAQCRGWEAGLCSVTKQTKWGTTWARRPEYYLLFLPHWFQVTKNSKALRTFFSGQQGTMPMDSESRGELKNAPLGEYDLSYWNNMISISLSSWGIVTSLPHRTRKTGEGLIWPQLSERNSLEVV